MKQSQLENHVFFTIKTLGFVVVIVWLVFVVVVVLANIFVFIVCVSHLIFTRT